MHRCINKHVGFIVLGENDVEIFYNSLFNPSSMVVEQATHNAKMKDSNAEREAMFLGFKRYNIVVDWCGGC